LIVANYVRKSAHVWFGLCERHRRHRMLGKTISVGGPLLFFVTMIAGAAMNSGLITIGSLAAIPACATIGWLLARVAWAERIDDNCAFLHVGPAFLETISTTPTTPSLYLPPEYVKERIPFGGAAAGAATSGPVRKSAPVAYAEPSTPEQIAEQERKWGPKQSPAPDGDSGGRP
jgi:hypothetical protein